MLEQAFFVGRGGGDVGTGLAGERYNGWFWDSGTFPRFRVSFQRSSRTPLCHFDKLEGQREQPGDSANLSL